MLEKCKIRGMFDGLENFITNVTFNNKLLTFLTPVIRYPDFFSFFILSFLVFSVFSPCYVYSVLHFSSSVSRLSLSFLFLFTFFRSQRVPGIKGRLVTSLRCAVLMKIVASVCTKGSMVVSNGAQCHS